MNDYNPPPSSTKPSVTPMKREHYRPADVPTAIADFGRRIYRAGKMVAEMPARRGLSQQRHG